MKVDTLGGGQQLYADHGSGVVEHALVGGVRIHQERVQIVEARDAWSGLDADLGRLRGEEAIYRALISLADRQERPLGHARRAVEYIGQGPARRGTRGRARPNRRTGEGE